MDYVCGSQIRKERINMLDKEIENKLIEWVKNNYSPKACGIQK